MAEQIENFDGAALVVEIRTVASGARVIRLAGELDISNVDRLDRAIESLFASSPGQSLMLDVSGLTFMDSSGISSLLRVASTGTAVQLLQPTRAVREVVKATRLEQTLLLVD